MCICNPDTFKFGQFTNKHMQQHEAHFNIFKLRHYILFIFLAMLWLRTLQTFLVLSCLKISGTEICFTLFINI